MATETPDGLHRMSYAAHILEEILAWPSKGNAELVADCILSISKSKKLSIKHAHDYLVRAIRLAKEQGIEVNHFFFSNGEYTLVRPLKAIAPEYKPPTKAELAALAGDKESLFASPEWKVTMQKLNEKFGCTQREVVISPERRAELKQQAERLRK
jgi:hypothetical protein